MTDDAAANAILVRAAHKEAARQLRVGPSYATAVPTSYDVKAELAELGIEVSRATVLAWCTAAKLVLADAESGDPDDITRKLPTSKP